MCVCMKIERWQISNQSDSSCHLDLMHHIFSTPIPSSIIDGPDLPTPWPTSHVYGPRLTTLSLFTFNNSECQILRGSFLLEKKFIHLKITNKDTHISIIYGEKYDIIVFLVLKENIVIIHFVLLKSTFTLIFTLSFLILYNLSQQFSKLNKM